jgi:hypothetical protein
MNGKPDKPHVKMDTLHGDGKGDDKVYEDGRDDCFY